MYRKPIILLANINFYILSTISLAGHLQIDVPKDDVIKKLITIVKDPSEPLSARIEAASIIGQLGAEAVEAIPALVSVLQRLRGRELEPLQLAIIEALGRMGRPAQIALPGLAAISGRSIDIDIAIKKTITSITSTSDDDDINSIVRQLNSKNISVKLQAIDRLRRLGDKAKEAIPSLYDLLNDDDSTIRNAAIDAIAAIQKTGRIDEQIIRAIAKDLNNPDPEYRLRAAYRLGKIGRDAIVVANQLNELRNDPDIEVRKIAQDALSKIIGR